VLDEMAIWRVRALVRFEYRRGMHAAVKTTHFVGGFAEIFGDEFIETGQCLRFSPAFNFSDVAFLNKNLYRLIEWTRHPDVPRPDDTDLINDAHALCIACANR